MTELRERLIEIGASLRLNKDTEFLIQEDLAEKIVNGEKVKIRSEEEGNHYICYLCREEEIILEAAQHVLEERYGRIELFADFADVMDIVEGFPITFRKDNGRAYNARFYEESGKVGVLVKRK